MLKFKVESIKVIVANRNISNSISCFTHYITERFVGSLVALCLRSESQDYVRKFLSLFWSEHFLFKNPIKLDFVFINERVLSVSSGIWFRIDGHYI
jgi:hypothetical protein